MGIVGGEKNLPSFYWMTPKTSFKDYFLGSFGDA
jgi:hypothetical protein